MVAVALSPEVHNTAIGVGIMALAGMAYLARWRRPECPDCGHCRARRQAEARDAVDRSHDYQHKGGGWRPGDPDRYTCADDTCPRNPRRD